MKTNFFNKIHRLHLVIIGWLVILIIAIILNKWFSDFWHNITIEQIDKEMIELSNQKAAAFVDIMKYFKSIWQTISSAEAEAYVNNTQKDIVYRIEYLKELKKELIEKQTIEKLRKE